VDWLIFAGIVVALIALGFVAQRFGWIDLSNKSRTSGSAGGAMGVGDEVFNPSRYESQIELDRQTMLPAPAPVAGDGDPSTGSGQADIYKGNVKIVLKKNDD